MKPCMGRNVQVCCESFSMSLADATGSFLPNRVIDEKVDVDVIKKADCITETVMLRDDMLQLSSDAFTLMDFRDVITFLCTT